MEIRLLERVRVGTQTWHVSGLKDNRRCSMWLGFSESNLWHANSKGRVLTVLFSSLRSILDVIPRIFLSPDAAL